MLAVMVLPSRPADAPLPVKFFSGASHITDNRLRAYLNSLEGRVDAFVGGTVSMVVDDVNGSDDASQDGSAANPLATIVEAEQRIAFLVESEVILTVKPHGGAGYVWPTFRARIFSGALAAIYVIFSEFNVVISGDTAQGGTTIEFFFTSGGLTPGALDGKTIEILDGAAAGDRRTIRDNTDTVIVPCAEFSAVPTGASYRIIEPVPGNVVIPTEFVPMVQGLGLPADNGPSGSVRDGSDGEYVPAVNLVNAIIDAPENTELVSGGRFVLLGCSLDAAPTLVRYSGEGQVLFGRQAWNTVVPPSTEPALTSSSWVGWGAHFTGGHWVSWIGSVPYVSGFLVTDDQYVVFGGRHDISGHIKGRLWVEGTADAIERSFVHVSFGKASSFINGPSMTPGKISADSAVAGVSSEGTALVQLYDETALTNLGIGPIILSSEGARVVCELQILLVGTNGGDGLQVVNGGFLELTAESAHASITLGGTVAGQLFSIGPRAINATMVDDFNNIGDFVSAARGFWDTGLVVTANAVTLATKGSVVAVEATTATSAGPKLIQNSATPAAGAAQVTYDAQGFATVTFNATDAVTVADIYVQPEDDGTMIRAVGT